jgi:hypothetical protein
MSYMNTDRDNFYDWAKDKPDTSAFAPLNPAHLTHTHPRRAHAGFPWARLAVLTAIVIALAVAYKLFTK